MTHSPIAIVGLGYVGLPLAIEFSKKYPVIGIDTDSLRVAQLVSGLDNTGVIKQEDLLERLAGKSELCSLHFGNSITDAASAGTYIITVPTPIDSFKKPDLGPLLTATEMVASVLKRGDIIIYESTVYPGCTEEDCVPVLEKYSGLRFNQDFFCGYSPERINVGDTVHTLTSIVKITSGSTPEIADIVDHLYASIIDAGTFKAGSIRVAEAAKAIENAQRDLNISFVNELALIFDKMGIDTQDVLAAAGTKWNFLPFQPGLVGGHCIGVDPYYLMHKAQALGYQPKVLLSGREVNEGISGFIADKVSSLLERKGKNIDKSRILILGITFKENSPDIRNSRVIDLYLHLLKKGAIVSVFDPHADPIKVQTDYSIPLSAEINYENGYDAIILAVAHRSFSVLHYDKFKAKGAVIYDIKSFLDRNIVDGRL